MIHKIHFAPYKSAKFTLPRENSDDFADSCQPKIIFQEQGTPAQVGRKKGKRATDGVLSNLLQQKAMAAPA